MNIATKKFFFVQFLLDASVCLTCVHIIVLPRVRHSEMLFITVLSPKEILIHLFQKDGADFNRWRWQPWLHLWQNHCFYTGHSFYMTFHWCAVYSFLLLKWIENNCVAVKLLELWPNIVKMVNHWEKSPKPKRQSSKSYSIKAAAVNNDLTSAELHFFSFVAGIF